MIITLEIGIALTLVVLGVAYVSSLPKPRRVPIRVKDQAARRDGSRQA